MKREIVKRPKLLWGLEWKFGKRVRLNSRMKRESKRGIVNATLEALTGILA